MLLRPCLSSPLPRENTRNEHEAAAAQHRTFVSASPERHHEHLARHVEANRCSRLSTARKSGAVRLSREHMFNIAKGGV